VSSRWSECKLSAAGSKNSAKNEMQKVRIEPAFPTCAVEPVSPYVQVVDHVHQVFSAVTLAYAHNATIAMYVSQIFSLFS
jgi:hypothetical protein